MNKEEYKTNLSILEDSNINLTSKKIWDDEPFSVELETYTDAGEDMIINLEEPTKELERTKPTKKVFLSTTSKTIMMTMSLF